MHPAHFPMPSPSYYTIFHNSIILIWSMYSNIQLENLNLIRLIYNCKKQSKPKNSPGPTTDLLKFFREMNPPSLLRLGLYGIPQVVDTYLPIEKKSKIVWGNQVDIECRPCQGITKYLCPCRLSTLLLSHMCIHLSIYDTSIYLKLHCMTDTSKHIVN